MAPPGYHRGVAEARRAVGTLALVAALAAISAAVAIAGPGGARQPPQLVQLSYAESDDGSSPKRSLYAFARRAASVKFVTRYDGDRARAGTRYRSSITDTDLHGHDVRHPWALVRRDGGKRVLRLIHDALFERGSARVRVIARGGGNRVVTGVSIVLAECSQDPPFYPVSCEVRP